MTMTVAMALIASVVRCTLNFSMLIFLSFGDARPDFRPAGGLFERVPEAHDPTRNSSFFASSSFAF
jgi:hypothetical protein